MSKSRLAFALPWIAAILVVLALLSGPALADCECGYSILAGTENYTVFTDVLETDFTLQKMLEFDHDWAIQEWTLNISQSNGPYGRNTTMDALINNPIIKGTTKGVNGTDPGMQLWVKAPKNINQEVIDGGEFQSNRTDMLHGTFRAAIQMTSVNGTCGAFFWYLNDTMEIDMEFLKARENETGYPVQIVIHSKESSRWGGDASRTSGYRSIMLPFDPTTAVHEYRFDWTPRFVKFFADGQLLRVVEDPKLIPTNPGKIVFNHWSDGSSGWSYGPPKEDAAVLVQYFKGYFNTSTPQRVKDHEARCIDPTLPMAICPIPDQLEPPGIGNTYFFYKDPKGNKVFNQTIGGLKQSSALSLSVDSKLTSLILCSWIGLAIRLLF